MMACVETIPVPDSRQKVDELFLFWLSEPSTQEMLRKELAKVRGGREIGEDSCEFPVSTPPSVTSVPRPGSPTVRSPSPPLLLSRSPKSPKTKISSRSPKKTQRKHAGDALKAKGSNKVEVIEEVDFPGVSEQVARPLPEPPIPPNKANIVNENKLRGGTKKNAAPVNSSDTIPRFYFPNGKCRSDENVEESLKEVAQVFHEYPNSEVPVSKFQVVVKVCCIHKTQQCTTPLLCTQNKLFTVTRSNIMLQHVRSIYLVQFLLILPSCFGLHGTTQLMRRSPYF